MKHIRLTAYFLVLMAFAISIAGYGHASEDEESGHEEASAGATFKPGKGVMVSERTRQILGLSTADVEEKNMPKIIPMNVQIFGKTHRFSEEDASHGEDCDVHGSGFIPPNQASVIESKQLVKIKMSDGQELDGFVLSVQENLMQGEVEVLIGIKDASEKLKEGDFVTATVLIPRKEPVVIIPPSALLHTAEDTFVYVVNGDAFYRTVVKVGSETEEQVEIMDGLFAGDKIVTQPVEALWLIELRATKGGGHSH